MQLNFSKIGIPTTGMLNFFSVTLERNESLKKLTLFFDSSMTVKEKNTSNEFERSNN